MNKKLLKFAFYTLMATTIPSLSIAHTGSTATQPTDGTEETSLIIQDVAFSRAEGATGDHITMGTIHVKAVNIKSPVTFEIRGTDRAQFSVSQASIAAGTSETDVTVYYNPTKVKLHKATLSIDCATMPTESKTVALKGIAIDRNNPPVVTLTPNTAELFTCEERKTAEQTLMVKSKNMADYVYVTLAQKKVFHLNVSQIFRNIENPLRITFAPLKAGEYKDTLIVSGYGLETQRIPLAGKATASTEVIVKEGGELNLSAENPLKELNEGFDNIQKNKPLALDRWTNVAQEGTRAWWGYSFPDYDELPGEQAAKVTPFDSKVEIGAETPCEMLLVTPPLDFKNSKSKIFTMRVRGDYLQDNQTDMFTVYYMDVKDGSLFKSEIQGFDLPRTKDRRGEWNEYHMDLTGQNIADVFFIGFGFKSHRGTANSATYYIDDVSYGRTDLPEVSPSQTELSLTAVEGREQMFDIITVTTKNTKEKVKLSVGGPNASKFKLTIKELPKEGGTFSIKFKSDRIGVHHAYVKIASRGAADKYIALSANNTAATGIEDVLITDGAVTVCDVSGNVVLVSDTSDLQSATQKLKPGVYIVKAKGKSRKILVR